MRFLLAILLFPLVANATIRNVPGAYATVQAGIDAAQPGDTVLLAAGTYAERVNSVRNGSSGSPIIIDGQNVASVQHVSLNHPYHTLQNLSVLGPTGTFDQDIVLLYKGAHFSTIDNCIIDAASSPVGKYGIQFYSSSGVPYDALNPSNCIIEDTTIRHVRGSTFVSMVGDDNIMRRCTIEQGETCDCVRLFGRRNLIYGNNFRDHVQNPAISNHPDFIQTFGNNGNGSKDHIIEGNVIRNLDAMQLTQLEGNLISEIGNWTFRNNLIQEVGGGMSCTIPDMKFYNNVFYRCNLQTGGHPLNFSSRAYEFSSVSSSSSYYSQPQFTLTNVPSGQLVQGRLYYCRYAASQTALVFHYDGNDYHQGQTFTATATTTYTVDVAGAEIRRAFLNSANNALVKDNAFIECGSATKDTVGWYSYSSDLTSIAADYNYVCRAGWAPCRPDTLMRQIGDPGGWDFQKWYEVHGINGGDPMLTDVSVRNFFPLTGSLLINAGVTIGSVVTDFSGATRPQGTASDIGAYEYGSGAPPPPDPPAVIPAPSSLAAVALSASTISMTWVDNSTTETGFEIQRSLDNVSWVTITTKSANAVSHINTGLAASTTYYYRVRAVLGTTSVSDWSNTSTATTQDTPTITIRSPRRNIIGLTTP